VFIRLILLSMLAAIGYFAFVRRHSFPIHVVIIFLLLAMSSLLVVFPELTSRIAAVVGVGRGADLVTYFVEVGVLFVVLKYYTKFVEIEEKLVGLTREIALLRASLEENAQADASGG
jgi:hypothetical protein